MAFEDRYSPDTAKSPNSGSEVQQNSPESSRTSAYTCQIINHNFKEERNVYSTSLEAKQEKTNTHFFSITSYALDKEDTTSSSSGQNEDPPALNYSIHNILQPDFGKSAILKTKTKPNNNNKIGFKPYEKTTAPLGSLCKTVSQIGAITLTGGTSTKTNVLADSDVVIEKKEDVKKDDDKDGAKDNQDIPQLWPAWVYCTRYSDRPSSGPRSRRMKKPSKTTPEEKRPRTAFSGAQLARLKHEFNENRYLTEPRRQQLSKELGLNEAQIKIWFQNKRAKIKKSSGQKNPLAIQLMAQGLYNHSTVPCDEDDMPIASPPPPLS